MTSVMDTQSIYLFSIICYNNNGMGKNAQEFGKTVDQTLESTVGMLGHVPANFVVDLLMFENPFSACIRKCAAPCTTR